MTTTSTSTLRWELVAVRVIAIYMAVCDLGAVLGLVAAYTLAPIAPPSSFAALSAASLLSAAIAFVTAKAAFTNTDRARTGFRVLLGLCMVTIALVPSSFASAPQAGRWFLVAATSVQGLVMYGAPLALLFRLDRGRARHS